MISENELQECIEAVKRIETLMASIENKLSDIAGDIRSELDSRRERDFWDEYQRYANDGDI